MGYVRRIVCNVRFAVRDSQKTYESAIRLIADATTTYRSWKKVVDDVLWLVEVFGWIVLIVAEVARFLE